MPACKPLLCACLLAAAFAAPLHAEMMDSGPMGVGASGVPTPDASVLSTMRLPPLATPVPLTPGAAVAIKADAVRLSRARARWLQMEAIAARLDGRERLGKLSAEQAAMGRSELARLQDKYRFHSEEQGQVQTPSQSKRLRLELGALERRLDPPKPRPTR